jgi:NhaP-type Na+/H+ or K+/H+ antiporter
VAEYLNLNGGIAVLIFGITLGNAHLLKETRFKEVFPSKALLSHEKDFFSELVFIFTTFFFVYVGVCMKFGSIGIYAIALLIVVAIILVRPLSIKLLVKTKMSFKDLGIMAIMAPKGLVPAILASIPIQYGLAGGESIQMLSFAVVLLSIIICSILVVIVSKNPFQIGYLKTVLKTSNTEENTTEREVKENLKNEISIPTEETSDNSSEIKSEKE